MLAFISQRESINERGVACDVLEKAYVDFVQELGFDAVPVSNFAGPMPDELWRQAGLVLLTGGGDLPAFCYVGPTGELSPQPNRERTEKQLFDAALEYDIPLLGICRGMQLIHAFLGGKTTRKAVCKTPRACGAFHPAENGTWTVNHYHDDAIFFQDMSQDVQLIFKDTDNDTVEAFHNPYKRLMGLQYHPEREFPNAAAKAKSDGLIKLFVKNRGAL